VVGVATIALALTHRLAYRSGAAAVRDQLQFVIDIQASANNHQQLVLLTRILRVAARQPGAFRDDELKMFARLGREAADAVAAHGAELIRKEFESERRVRPDTPPEAEEFRIAASRRLVSEVRELLKTIERK
jgi:hypothetical protein